MQLRKDINVFKLLYRLGSLDGSKLTSKKTGLVRFSVPIQLLNLSNFNMLKTKFRTPLPEKSNVARPENRVDMSNRGISTRAKCFWIPKQQYILQTTPSWACPTYPYPALPTHTLPYLPIPCPCLAQPGLGARHPNALGVWLGRLVKFMLVLDV